MTIAPDTKDWTWVLDKPCPECGFDAPSVAVDTVAGAIRDNAAFWARVLTRDGVAQRPEPGVWSPVEYACHVRDVHRVFTERLTLMLAQDDPLFANWDQDATAAAERYDLQTAPVVASELAVAAEAAAAAYETVGPDRWGRPGRRSNGSIFTVATLGRYQLHDLVHHRWDLRRLSL